MGRELHAILTDTLGKDICNDMLKKVFLKGPGPRNNHGSQPHQQHRSSTPINFSNFNAAAAAAAAAIAAATFNGANNLVNKSIDNYCSPIDVSRGLGNGNKKNAFSIDNLLSSRHVPGSLLNAAAAAASITQPVGFFVNNHKVAAAAAVGDKHAGAQQYDELDEDSDLENDVLSHCSFRSNNSDGSSLMSPKRCLMVDDVSKWDSNSGDQRSRIQSMDAPSPSATDLSMARASDKSNSSPPVVVVDTGSLVDC